MKTFSHGKPGRTIVLRLDQGDDVLDCVNQAIEAHQIRDGYIASGIGTLDECVLHMVMTTGYPPVEHFARWQDKPLEVASISGIIADGFPHLHTVISDHEKAYAGHLERGCRILYLGEVVIQEILDQPLTRRRNAKNINELTDRDCSAE